MIPLDALEKRIAELGNHYQKYIYIIHRYKDSLIETLTRSGQLMQIHLWRTSFSPQEEMRIISGLTDDTESRVHHLSCYYALQSLYMNLRNLDILELGIASEGTLPEVYHHFMMQIGSDFRELTRLYIQNLLNIYLPQEKQPEFFVCSVGTRSDQDDIDIGIITADHTSVTELNRAFQKITQDMLVYATPLHLYLSEHVGSKHLYTSTISEYHQMLTKKIQDVVIISELLNARLILGSVSLFKKFQSEIISIYFSRKNYDIRFHEGFLRGILGEVRSWLIKPVANTVLAPKDDALRMIKSILYAKKTIHRLKEVNAWDIITALMTKEPKSYSRYKFLFEATSFLEMFKFLLQMYIVQEETFRPGEIDEQQRNLLSEKMGYCAIGMITPWEQLITDYYHYVKEVRKHCEALILEISAHLSTVSIFPKLLRTKKIKSLPREFIITARFFKGTKYWDDLLDLLEKDESLLNRFIDDFNALKPEKRQALIDRYVQYIQSSAITLFRFLTILGKKQQYMLEYMLGDTLFLQITRSLIAYAQNLSYITQRLCRVFHHYPSVIHEFYKVLPHSYFTAVKKLLQQPVVDDSTRPYYQPLLHLTNLHGQSSQYFKRIFFRIITINENYLKSLLNLEQLSKIAAGLLAQVDTDPNPKRKKHILAQYHDTEFLRIGIGTLQGRDFYVTNREYSNFCDQYMKKLFDICEEELGENGTNPIVNLDTFALFCAGGHAREEAYDDDYDIIALIDSDSEEDITYVTRVIARMNREMVKIGLIPHYRLGEILGGFITPISKLIHYLEHDKSESFIDLSQLLGARMIIGNDKMEALVRRKILQTYIFNEKTTYIKRMVHEIEERQNKQTKKIEERCNLKEIRGGLRDIEAVALILKAYLRQTTPNLFIFFNRVKNKLPLISKQIDILINSAFFIRTIRDLHRITEAAEDKIRLEDLPRLAILLHKNNIIKNPDAEQLIKQIRTTLHASANACVKIIRYILQTS
jgi:hypothetical protein